MIPPGAPPQTLPIQDASPLLGSPDALRKRFHDDGFLYLKARLPREKVEEVRDGIFSICKRMGWFDEGAASVERASPQVTPAIEGEEEFFRVYDEIQRLESFHGLAHQAEILEVMRVLLDESAFPHPLSICRLMFPHNIETTTPPHQDYPNNQGATELYACWVPLTDCPESLGGLAFLPGSHKHGVLPLEFSLGAGGRQAVLPPELQDRPWVSGNYEAGDVLIFHSLTLHRALDNVTERMRLSVDYRYQAVHDPVTEKCLLPHFQRLTWEEIYRGWKRSDLKYYWRPLSLTMAPWTTRYHDLPETHLKEAIKMTRAYKSRREAQASKR